MSSEIINTLDMAITDVNSEFLGVKRLILMENAGKGLAELVREIYHTTKRNNIVILCGRGGNGGDGMVAARHLARYFPVFLYLLGTSNEIKKKSTLSNLNIIKNMEKSIRYYEIRNVNDVEKIKINSTSVIVDCLLGTGISGSIREPLVTILTFLAEWQKKGAVIVSADTPSGINPDNGTESNVFLTPDFTGTFHKLKMGLTTQNSGKISIIPIGVPPEAETIIGPGDLLALKPRQPWSKKGDNGKILIIGGNEIYSGAPALAAMAAIQIGADLVTILAPEKNSTAIRSYSPELIVNDYIESHLTPNSISNDLIKKNDVIVIGPGLGLRNETKQAFAKIMEVVKKLDKPIIIDADALKMLKLTDVTPNTILTPHAGEFENLTGVKLPNSAKEFEKRVKTVEKLSKQHYCTWVIKGHWDIVADKYHIKINKTGTPRMTRGGTGDILSGLIAGLTFQTKDPFYSSCIGAYINGRAGELAEKKFSLSNLLSCVPTAIEESFDFINQD